MRSSNARTGVPLRCRAGAYHLEVQEEVLTALRAPYTPEEYPTPAMRAMGMVCGCSFFWQDPCRTEFRQASRRRSLAWQHEVHSRGATRVCLVPHSSWWCPLARRTSAPHPEHGCGRRAGARLSDLELAAPGELPRPVSAPRQAHRACWASWLHLPCFQPQPRSRLQKVDERAAGEYDGNNSPMIAPHTGSPAITVPMGYTGTQRPGLAHVTCPPAACASLCPILSELFGIGGCRAGSACGPAVPGASL